MVQQFGCWASQVPLAALQEVSSGAKLPLGLHTPHAKCSELLCLLRRA